MSTADWHSSTDPHRHFWLREGRMIEVCARCPAARPRSRVARGLSLLVLGVGLVAVAGMLVRIWQSDSRLTLASCSGHSGSHFARVHGGGC